MFESKRKLREENERLANELQKAVTALFRMRDGYERKIGWYKTALKASLWKFGGMDFTVKDHSP